MSKMTTYEKSFKEQAVKLSDEIGIKKAAAQLGIPYYTLADWRHRQKATYKLVQYFHPKKVYMNFIIEITDEGLHGRDLFEGIELTTLLTV